MSQYLWLTFELDPGRHFSPHSFTCTLLPCLAKRRISRHAKAKCFLQSPLPYFRRNQEQTLSKPRWPLFICSLSFKGLRLHIYASISPGTEVKINWCQLCCSFSQVPQGPSSTWPPVPGHWVCSSLPSLACLWEGTFHSHPVLWTILSGNPSTADVADDCHKTWNRDLSLRCYQPSWWGDKRADLRPFIKITQNWLFIEVELSWKVQAQSLSSS